MIKEFFFLLLAIIIFPLLAVVGIFYTFFKHLFKGNYSMKKQLNPIIRSMSLCLDGFANAGAGELLNDALKVPENSKIWYGKWYQTISAVTGLLLVYEKKETRLRKFLEILGKNHCQEAITEEEHYYYGNK